MVNQVPTPFFYPAALALATVSSIGVDSLIYPLFRKILGPQTHQKWAITAAYAAVGLFIAISDISKELKALTTVVFLVYKSYSTSSHKTADSFDNYPPGPTRDVLILWKALASEINVDFCFNEFGSYTITDQFDQWIWDHKIALSQVKILSIDCGDLTTLPPQIFQFTGLISLMIPGNKLKTLPSEIGHFAHLEVLDISNNKLKTLPPEICQLKNLKELNISNNKLETLPPEFGQLTELLKLNISMNPWRGLPPEIFQIISLKSLDLFRVNLRVLSPEIGRLINLESLHICNNYLTELPTEIRQLIHLKQLSLFRNEFTVLPPFLALLSANCHIFAYWNRLTPESIIAFQTCIQAVRRCNPGLGPRFFASIHEDRPSIEGTLDDSLMFWLGLFQKEFPEHCEDKQGCFPRAGAADRFCLNFYATVRAHPGSDNLHILLQRLKETSDYRNGGRTKQNMILRVGHMLQQAVVNTDFCARLFPILENGLAERGCGDRITVIFDDIEIEWHLSQSEAFDEVGLAKLLVGLKRKDELDKIAWRRIDELRLGDQIEVFLFYHIKLKDQLQLPISTEEMLYSEVAGITVEMLAEDGDKVLKTTQSAEAIAQILPQYDKWSERVKALHPEAFKPIEAISEQIDTLIFDKSRREGETKQAIDALHDQQKRLEQEIIAKLTKKWVDENFQLL